MQKLAKDGELMAFNIKNFGTMDTLRDKVALEEMWEKIKSTVENLVKTMNQNFWKNIKCFDYRSCWI